MNVYDAEISITKLYGDSTETRTHWGIDLETGLSCIDDLAAQLRPVANWGTFTTEGAAPLTVTAGRPERRPGAYICVTLLHSDGTEIRAAWQIDMVTADQLLEGLATLHGTLPDRSDFCVAGQVILTFIWDADADEAQGIS
ncbi:hypothetical protein AB0O34_10070 [Sphaerisporangium sp. NPDC088356]|uniref:hypothetical protein n=1 Tax=Sphaerisporangium sp. NPDC088356 TaxID=3154871 RepID=UPI0034468AA3